MRVWLKTYVRVRHVILIGILLFFSQNSSFALEIALQWDENGEPDLAGYEIFYNLIDKVVKQTNIANRPKQQL